MFKRITLMFERVTYEILNSISGLLMILCFLCTTGALLALAVAVIVGLWDGIVWLTKSDWRTTNFSVPLIAFAVAIVLGIIGRVSIELGENFKKDAAMFENAARRLEKTARRKEKEQGW